MSENLSKKITRKKLCLSIKDAKQGNIYFGWSNCHIAIILFIFPTNSISRKRDMIYVDSKKIPRNYALHFKSYFVHLFETDLKQSKN